jgi:O-antigen/teichoic acid export membrane protein
MLARNALLNLAGHGAPLLAALFLLPPLVSRLDAERFGFLALAWALVGYFSLFDLGLGRALSRLVAERRGTAREPELPHLSRTALSLTLALGTAAGLLLFAAAGPICERVLNLSPALRSEAETALRVLALSLPLVTLTAALRGLLEAGQRFDWVNAIRVPVGILTFAAPLVATWWSVSLVGLASALALMRLAAFVAHWAACVRLWPALVGLGSPRGAAAREMLGFGAWLTVSNVVGPLMVYIDRFVIAGLLAVSWVAYYSAPYELVTRLYRTGTKAVLITVFPLALVATVFAQDWLHAWLGPEFAARGMRVAQLLCVGAAVNCLAYLPFTLLQARGRADLPAKAHLVELPLYLAVLWALVARWGIEGAALAWALRCVADAAVLFLLARGRVRPGFTGPQMLTVVVALLALGAALIPFGITGKVVYTLAALAVFCVLGWLVLLDEAERSRARHPFALLSGDPPR